MPFIVTTAVRKIAGMRARNRILQGGSSAGKTIGIISTLITTAQKNKGKLISVVSETFPHLQRGAIRDFLNIVQEHGMYEEASWNRTDHIYTFPTGSKIEFFSADAPGKVRGPRRDILFLNEANNISYETYTQLAIRSNDYIFIDYNPVSEFWVHEEIVNSPTMVEGKDYDFAIVTYKDNEALPQAVVDELERRQNNRSFWKVYGLGEIGDSEGRVYTGWETVDDIPHEARLEGYGLDFGYSNDPTALIAIHYYNGGYILDEVIYQKGMLNGQIADVLDGLPKALVTADSAEPKSIEEIKLRGHLILPATKGPGSVNFGIDKVKAQRISVTKNSTNLLKEYRNYMWMRDRDGHFLSPPKPEDAWNHCLDAIRYRFESLGQSALPDLTVTGWTEGLGGILIPEYDIK